MIYTACKYAPGELFSGFLETASRLDPAPASFSCADGCSHPNMCGFAKAVIEEVNEKKVRELVITDCCDAMRRTFDVLLGEELSFIYFLPLPHKTGRGETAMLSAELKKLKNAYEKYSGKCFSWERAWEACKENIKDKEDAREYVSVSGAHGGSALIAQTRAVMPDIYIKDDTCSGDRTWRASAFKECSPKNEEEFFLCYARLLLTGPAPCMRMLDIKARARYDTGIKGIIYHTMKFCDYYSFEYADIRGRAGVPILKIETDATPQASGQLKTRIEAFGETLGLNNMKKTDTLAARASARFVAGLDSGSTSTDAVIMDKDKNIVGSAVIETGMSATKSAREALSAALSEAGISENELLLVVATGYGRDFIDIKKQTMTEITCHARGAAYLFPGARTVIDIGGQDSKIIRIDEGGNVQGFVMNDKCAAGTGRFLEMQARALGLSLAEMSRMGLRWRNEVKISSMCTVFAESEVVSLVAKDTAVEDIIHGLNESVASKTESLITRAQGKPGFAMTGGVSKNTGVVECLEKRLGQKISVSPRSQLCGAIGAALIGWSEFLEK
ncbi:MAG: 2-hydroxyacyl-CoA dehydratase [Clostridia bacterium]|nr:2-hydroxyacyl-CoA dehydratase [Clostridia bacterium]